MAGTYVQIDRDELEAWLDTLRLHGKAYRAPNKAGVYLLPFSDTVACKLSSTIGTSDDAMGRGMASMQLSLVSRVTGQTLNKKAQGQSHFKRTLNWKKTWAEGVERMRDAYAKSAGFYDALAAIEDRDQYKIDVMTAIESIPDWRNNNILADFHGVAEKGGILTLKQVDLLDRTLDRERGRQAPAAPAKPVPEAPKAEDPLLPILRALYAKARAVGNNWLMDFTKSVADQINRGRQLSPKQMEIIEKSRAQFKVARSIQVGDTVQIPDFGGTEEAKVIQIVHKGKWPYEGMPDDHPGAFTTDLAVVKTPNGRTQRIPLSYFTHQRVAARYLASRS